MARFNTKHEKQLNAIIFIKASDMITLFKLWPFGVPHFPCACATRRTLQSFPSCTAGSHALPFPPFSTHTNVTRSCNVKLTTTFE